MCSWTDCMFCWPSTREIVVVSGLKPPASTLVVPPVSDGLNGSWAPGHGPPFGPVMIWNFDSACFVAAASSPGEAGVLGSALHGTNVALVV